MIKATKEVKTVKEVQRRDGKSDKSVSRCRLERERWNSTSSSSTSLKVQWSSSFLTAARSHRWVKLKSTILVLFSYPDLIWDSHELNISPNISTIHRWTGSHFLSTQQGSRRSKWSYQRWATSDKYLSKVEIFKKIIVQGPNLNQIPIQTKHLNCAGATAAVQFGQGGRRQDEAGSDCSDQWTKGENMSK